METTSGHEPATPGRLGLSRRRAVPAVTPGEHRESPLIRLPCLDDDAPGREIGARIATPESHGLGKPARQVEHRQRCHPTASRPCSAPASMPRRGRPASAG